MVHVTRTLLFTCFVVSAIFSAPEGSSAEGTADSVCEAVWAAETRDDLPPGRHILFVDGTTFADGGETYAAGVGLAESDSATLLIFRVAGPTEAELVFELRFSYDFVSVEDRLRASMSGCDLPDLSPYMKVSVHDLDADGRQEIILESNQVGVCADCLSSVRVFQLQGSEVRSVVEENYNGLAMGDGEGLTLDSWVQGIDGRVIPTQKRFFTRIRD